MTKVPYQANGKGANPTDRRCFTDFDTACGNLDGNDGIGIGISDDIVAIDIDHCVDMGVISDLALDIIETTYSELADLLGMDGSMLKMLYTVRSSESQINNWSLSMHTIINFLINNSDMLGSMMGNEQISSLAAAQAIINGSVNGTSYTADQISGIMGMSKEQAQQLYLLYTSRHGDTSGWTLPVKGFIDFIIDDVLSNSEYADKIDADTSDMLSSARTMVDAVISGEAYTAAEMGTLLGGLTDELESSMVELICTQKALKMPIRLGR